MNVSKIEAGSVRHPALNNTVAYMGSLISFLVDADDSGGGLAIMQAHAMPGNEPPPHFHHVEHEIIHVMEGETEFYIEGEQHPVLARAGDTVFLPCGKAHGMKIHSEVRWLVIVHAVDGGEVALDAFFRQTATGPAVSLDLPHNMERYANLSSSEVSAIAPPNMSFLSPEETARRLPHYPGFGAA